MTPAVVTPVVVMPVAADALAALRALRVHPEQERYSGGPTASLASEPDDARWQPMMIVAGGDVVGFYRLELAPETIVGERLGRTRVGVRAFMIDARYQGLGYGGRAVAALCADLRNRHPQRRLAMLLVHCRNRPAIAMYRNSGFVDTGRLFAGGNAGPQHLMQRALFATRAGAMGQ